MNEEEKSKEGDVISIDYGHKPILEMINGNPFANEHSQERKDEAHNWTELHQQELQTFIGSEKEQEIDSQVILIPHGSVSRGHAQEDSDIDGNFWFYDKKASPGFIQIDNADGLFPRKDWGGSFHNVHDLLTSIHELTAGLTNLKERTDRENFIETTTRIKNQIASLLGPTSENMEESSDIEEWRNLVTQELAQLNTKLLELSGKDSDIHPAMTKFWQQVQKEWYFYFINFEKRAGEMQATIDQKLKERFDDDEEKVERARKKVNKIRENVKLPDLDSFF